MTLYMLAQAFYHVFFTIPYATLKCRQSYIKVFFAYRYCRAKIHVMQYEIEIKTLLGSKQASDNLLKAVRSRDPKTTLVSEQHQLNHYFRGGDLAQLASSAAHHLSESQRATLSEINEKATHINVRTRQKNDTVLLIVKGSLDATSAVHSHHRMEFEAPVTLSINELDELILNSGWQLEAKWQADRKIYDTLGLTLDLYFTPGYGYMAEFERVVSDNNDRQAAHQQLVDVMESLGVQELPNDRLERMFAYYNQHWPEYYGTKKVFTVE